MMNRTVLAVWIWTIAAWSAAFGQLPNDPPKVAKDYLKDDGYPTGRHFQEYEGSEKYIAASVAKKLGTEPLPNYILYSIEGTESKVESACLALVVNQKGSAGEAHRALAELSEKLVKKASGKPISNEIKNSIVKGVSGKWSLGTTSVRVERDDPGNWDGYDLRLWITPLNDQAKNDDAKIRVWKSADGAFQRKATFVAMTNSVVQLETDAGIVKVPLEKLSQEDQEFIRAQKGRK